VFQKKIQEVIEHTRIWVSQSRFHAQAAATADARPVK